MMNKRQQAINDVKNLIVELMTLFVTMPDGKLKNEFRSIIFMVRREAPLKNILERISSIIQHISNTTYEDPTTRKRDQKFWDHVLNLFISTVPNKKR